MLGGLTTFITMAYIIVVNPQILSQAGMPAEGVVFATCLAAAVARLGMGLYANYPIALAPGMSLNAYFTYTVCIGMHVPWRVALPNPSSTFLKMDLRGALHLGLVEIIFIFLFVDLFDNVGTMVGVCEQGGFVKDGKIPRVERMLLADGIGTMFGAMTGTSTVTSYIESASAVAAGAASRLVNAARAGAFFSGGVFLSLGGGRPAGGVCRPRVV